MLDLIFHWSAMEGRTFQNLYFGCILPKSNSPFAFDFGASKIIALVFTSHSHYLANAFRIRTNVRCQNSIGRQHDYKRRGSEEDLELGEMCKDDDRHSCTHCPSFRRRGRNIHLFVFTFVLFGYCDTVGKALFVLVYVAS